MVCVAVPGRLLIIDLPSRFLVLTDIFDLPSTMSFISQLTSVLVGLFARRTPICRPARPVTPGKSA